MGDPIPHPRTTDQEFLAAIHTRLGEILDRLPSAPAPEGADGTVELSEPKTPPRPAPPKATESGKREPAGGRGSPRPAARRKPAPKPKEAGDG